MNRGEIESSEKGTQGVSEWCSNFVYVVLMYAVYGVRVRGGRPRCMSRVLQERIVSFTGRCWRYGYQPCSSSQSMAKETMREERGVHSRIRLGRDEGGGERNEGNATKHWRVLSLATAKGEYEMSKGRHDRHYRRKRLTRENETNAMAQLGLANGKITSRFPLYTVGKVAVVFDSQEKIEPKNKIKIKSCQNNNNNTVCLGRDGFREREGGVGKGM